MLSNEIQKRLDSVKKSSLIVDVETSSFYANGEAINIKTNFDDYISHARVKWVFMYSYKHNKEYYYEAFKYPVEIASLLAEHGNIVGFNHSEFDIPILINNGFIEEKRKFLQCDMMQILGTPNQKNKDGYSFKDRGSYMKYKFRKNSLRHMAEVMKLDFQKGDIDYKIFHKDKWTKEECKEIIMYGVGDLMSNKDMFDKVWNFWLPFAELLPEKNIYDLSWIRNSIANLTYKCACHVLEVEPTYGKPIEDKEEMGGNVILPPYEELEDVWYVDYASLYPHIFSMLNLYAEINEDDIENCEKVWHGNKLFKVKGYYDISEWHKLSRYTAEKLIERANLKKNDPTNPMEYSLKYLLNALYGVARSSLFEQVGSENCGWDCCNIGQQFQQFTSDMFDDFGFDTVGGDTDSLKVKARNPKDSNKEYVQECLNQIVEIIKDSVPFPIDTFDIKIEHHLKYIMWPRSNQEVIVKKIRDKINKGIIDGFKEELINKKKAIIQCDTGKVVKYGRSWVKERKSKKKNYYYVYEKDEQNVDEIIGLPIKKDNSTPLSMMIFKNELQETILKTLKAKFPKSHIDGLIKEYLKKEDVLQSLTREYRVQRADSYKKEGQIQAQISREYFNGDEGVISLIKNKKVGNVGLTAKYCTIKEAISNDLSIDDLDLEKTYNELAPFCIYTPKPEKEVFVKNVETGIEQSIVESLYLANWKKYEVIKPKKKKKVKK